MGTMEANVKCQQLTINMVVPLTVAGDDAVLLQEA